MDLRPEQVASLFEMHVEGKTFKELASHFGLSEASIKEYVFKLYYGIVPKEVQLRVVICSRV